MSGQFRAFWDEVSRDVAAKSELKRQRTLLVDSLRDQLWASSKPLAEFKSWFGHWSNQLNRVGALPWLDRRLRTRSWTKRWFVRVPTLVILRLVAFPFGIVAASFLFVVASGVAIVKLGPTYARFQRVKFRELAAFDQKVAEDKKAREREKLQEQINEKLRIEEQQRQEQAELAKQLTIFWIQEFRKSSPETILDVWAMLQQFPTDHYIYSIIENSPGPILREIVDREVTLRQISVEARQLALLRLERKRADTAQSDLIEQIAIANQQRSEERHSGVVDGLMAIALLQLVK